MLENVRTHAKKWSKATDSRTQLQHSYLAIAISVIAGAGIVSLFDSKTGRAVAGLGGGALLIFVINAVVWALLQSVLTSLFGTKRAK